MSVKIKVQRIENANMPSYSYEGDAGLDLFSSSDYLINPMENKLISTGIMLEIPNGYVGLIWDRSSLAVASLHSLAGVIDSHYRGEIKIVLFNLGKQPFKISKGMRIAQMLIQPIAHAKLVESQSLGETKRSAKGFGSSGL